MGKKLDIQKVRMYIFLLFAAAVIGGQISCSLFTSSPQSLPDYDNSAGFILDYAVGDRFAILQPMFLIKSGWRNFYLSKPGVGSPNLEQYTQDPKRFGEVVKLIPAGTLICIKAIKRGIWHTSTASYVLLEGGTEWVGLNISKYIEVGSRYHLTYDREYYRKIVIKGAE